jgi:hypothetical protein
VLGAEGYGNRILPTGAGPVDLPPLAGLGLPLPALWPSLEARPGHAEAGERRQ